MDNVMLSDVSSDKQLKVDLSAGLARLHTESFRLYLQTRGLQEKAVGDRSTDLNLMFEDQCEDLANAVYAIGEHIRKLNIPATVTYQEFSNDNSLMEIERVQTSNELVEPVISGHEQVLRTAMKVLQLAKIADDTATAAMVTDRMLVHEKTVWMLRTKSKHIRNAIEKDM